MSERTDIDFLRDIAEAIFRIRAYVKDIDYERFSGDTKTQDAVVRNLEIIGEAAKNISQGLKKKHTQIPWRDLAGVRDKLIHHYFGVNIDVVWGIAIEELPVLLSSLEQILKEH
ncbi:MAG: DUF86 domain-containing protein [Sedimentisphaerales bacterium]|jgi:uncharacterized protein with HEPN domain